MRRAANELDWTKMNCTDAVEHAVAVINTTCGECVDKYLVSSVLSDRRIERSCLGWLKTSPGEMFDVKGEF